MARVTKQEKLVWYFTKYATNPAHEIATKSRKYRVFQFPFQDYFYYVGKNGGLRRGLSYEGSISLTASAKGVFKKYDAAHAV